MDCRRSEALGIDPQLVDAAAGQPPCVGLVVDRELARVPQALGLGAQDARAGGVKRHQPHSARVALQQSLDPSAHLLGRLVGERDRQDLVRVHLLGVDQERHPVGQHARLAAARARQDQQRSLPVRDRLALGLVQPSQQALDPRFPIRGKLARWAWFVEVIGRVGGALRLGWGVVRHPAPRIDARSAGRAPYVLGPVCRPCRGLAGSADEPGQLSSASSSWLSFWAWACAGWYERSPAGPAPGRQCWRRRR